MFPGMAASAIATDTTFTVSNVFVGLPAMEPTNFPCFSLMSTQVINQMRLKRQGVAGTLIRSVVQLGLALFLGIADVIAIETEHRGRRESYRIVFWFEVALSALSFVILLFIIKIKTAKSDFTVNEMEALAASTPT